MDYQLTLYYSAFCGYCRKVLKFIEEHQLQVKLKDVNESSQNRQELFKAGGKTQVPCLIINANALYESADIIEWLKENIVKKDDGRRAKDDK